MICVGERKEKTLYRRENGRMYNQLTNVITTMSQIEMM
jgi:hypothetical protein